MLGFAEVSQDYGAVPSTARGRILVVDDYEAVRSIIQIFLENAGFAVCGEASSGTEAIEQAQRLNPDLIVLDLKMPQMNGAEAACVLSRTMPGVPIVALTMYEDYFGPALASVVGVKAIVSKADGLNKLVECVKFLLSAHNSKSESQA